MARPSITSGGRGGVFFFVVALSLAAGDEQNGRNRVEIERRRTLRDRASSSTGSSNAQASA